MGKPYTCRDAKYLLPDDLLQVGDLPALAGVIAGYCQEKGPLRLQNGVYDRWMRIAASLKKVFDAAREEELETARLTERLRREQDAIAAGVEKVRRLPKSKGLKVYKVVDYLGRARSQKELIIAAPSASKARIQLNRGERLKLTNAPLLVLAALKKPLIPLTRSHQRRGSWVLAKYRELK